MKKLFKKIKIHAQKIVNIQIRIILFLVYFIFLTPLCIFVKIFKDYLSLKAGPLWQCSKHINNVSDFLKEQ